MKKSLTKIVFVNFLVFLLSILIIEIFFGNWLSTYNFGPYMREHRLKKNPVYLNYNNETYHYIYKRNYHGFRGENLDPSQIQAVIIGGSTTDERYKPEEFTITENLNTLLRKKDYNFKIINAGIEGQSTVGHIYNFKHWFPKLKDFSPKLYIFYVGINDRLKNEDIIFDEDLNEEGIKKMGPSEAFVDNLKSRSFFYDKMRILKQKYYLSDSNVIKYDFSLKESEITNYKYINYNKALEIHDIQYLKTKYKEKISNYLKRIEILNNYVTKQNAVSIFINQVGYDGLSNEILFILNYALVEYCNKKNINYIDLAKKFDGKVEYFIDRVHTTRAGSSVIAQTIMDDLIEIIKKEQLFYFAN